MDKLLDQCTLVFKESCQIWSKKYRHKGKWLKENRVRSSTPTSCSGEETTLLTQSLMYDCLGFFQNSLMKEFPQPFRAPDHRTVLSLLFLIMFYLNLPSWKLGEHKNCLPVLFQLQKKWSVRLMRFAGRIQAPKQAILCVLYATPRCKNISVGTLMCLEITKWNMNPHVS